MMMGNSHEHGRASHSAIIDCWANDSTCRRRQRVNPSDQVFRSPLSTRMNYKNVRFRIDSEVLWVILYYCVQRLKLLKVTFPHILLQFQRFF